MKSHSQYRLFFQGEGSDDEDSYDDDYDGIPPVLSRGGVGRRHATKRTSLSPAVEDDFFYPGEFRAASRALNAYR